jgi:UMP-CMP kinase
LDHITTFKSRKIRNTKVCPRAVIFLSFLHSCIPLVVFVLGGPGSGKGTNCTRIVETFGYHHLSAGDLLRAERESGSKLADMINTFIKEGKIVPAEVTVGLLRTAMEKSGSDKFLVDGFPRDMDNLACWNKQMNDIADVQFLLFLDCPTEIMVERLLERGKTSGRNDDNIDSIRKRLITYEQSTRPIIENFRALGKVREVNSNRQPDEVFTEVSVHFTNASHALYTAPD